MSSSSGPPSPPNSTTTKAVSDEATTIDARRDAVKAIALSKNTETASGGGLARTSPPVNAIVPIRTPVTLSLPGTPEKPTAASTRSFPSSVLPNTVTPTKGYPVAKRRIKDTSPADEPPLAKHKVEPKMTLPEVDFSTHSSTITAYMNRMKPGTSIAQGEQEVIAFVLGTFNLPELKTLWDTNKGGAYPAKKKLLVAALASLILGKRNTVVGCIESVLESTET
jgi:hypothetical protein